MQLLLISFLTFILITFIVLNLQNFALILYNTPKTFFTNSKNFSYNFFFCQKSHKLKSSIFQINKTLIMSILGKTTYLH